MADEGSLEGWQCGVFRQSLGVAQHVGWNPVGEVLHPDAVRPGRCVLLADALASLSVGKRSSGADQGTPGATVDECHLSIHQPRPHDIWRVSEGVDGVEDRVGSME